VIGGDSRLKGHGRGVTIIIIIIIMMMMMMMMMMMINNAEIRVTLPH